MFMPGLEDQTVKTSDFSYFLPQELIAQRPLEPRDQSRLMVINREGGSIEHGIFSDLPGLLAGGDLLVFNNSRVIPARLCGRKIDTGGMVEILLLRRAGDGVWEALVKPGRRVKIGARIAIGQDSKTGVAAEITGLGAGGIKLVSFSDERLLARLGRVPLPPYIHTSITDPERYQTVYAREDGSVAAPTAGFHFTPGLLEKIRRKGIGCLFVTLHIGLDTFRPVSEEDPTKHPVYREYGWFSQETASKLSQAKKDGRRIIGVGTSTIRLLEFAAQASGGEIEPFAGWVNLFILPGYQFRMVTGLITNFHLPRSTPLMLVSAFAGRDFILKAYKEAIVRKYRFYSFGDAMLFL
jgi:S-adenosylmethionine:tRNA ribosyltransferase-isomerase